MVHGLRPNRRGRLRTCGRGYAVLFAAAGCLSVVLGIPRSYGSGTTTDPIQRQMSHWPWGRMATLHLVGGGKVRGAFAGMAGDWTTPGRYETRFESWQADSAVPSPRIRERLAVALTSGDTLRGRFEGFGPSLIVLARTGRKCPSPVAFAAVSGVWPDSGSNWPAWSTIERAWGQAPVIALVALRFGEETVAIPRDRIERVQAKPHDMGPAVVMGTVAGVLVLTYWALRAMWNDAAREAGRVTGT